MREYIFIVAFIITNGPQDTTMCTNQLADCTCGFVGGDPNNVVPDWRIIKRSSNGTIISNVTISGSDIIRDTTDRLEWIPDLANPNNCVLRVGPVSKADNQSSYQCTFATILNGLVVSEVGKLTVLGEVYVYFIAHYVRSTYC